MPSLAPIAATFGLLAGGLGLAGYLGFLPGGCGGCCEAPPTELVAPGALGDDDCPHGFAAESGKACPHGAAPACGNDAHGGPQDRIAEDASSCPHAPGAGADDAAPIAEPEAEPATHPAIQPAADSIPDGATSPAPEPVRESGLA